MVVTRPAGAGFTSPRHCHWGAPGRSSGTRRALWGDFFFKSPTSAKDTFARQRGRMDDQNPTAMKRPSGRPAVLVCSIALAAAAGASASLVPDGWRAPVHSASLQSAAALFGRSASGPTSFADVVEAVKPAVIGAKTNPPANVDEQDGPAPGAR